MTITYRGVKGQALDATEYDATILDLDTRPNGQVFPKEKGVGLKLDSDAPDWGWRDLTSTIRLGNTAQDPDYVAYQGSLRQPQFSIGDEIYTEFHLPHDYAEGTDIYIHAHWSHNSASVTSGGVVGVFEASYAKGHNQGFFGTPVIVPITEDASPVRYQHLVTEGPLSASAGAGGLLVTEDLEPDGVILARLELTGNTMDGGAKPFLHFVDIHYQSTGLATKNRAPSFYA